MLFVGFGSLLFFILLNYTEKEVSFFLFYCVGYCWKERFEIT